MEERLDPQPVLIQQTSRSSREGAWWSGAPTTEREDLSSLWQGRHIQTPLQVQPPYAPNNELLSHIQLLHKKSVTEMFWSHSCAAVRWGPCSECSSYVLVRTSHAFPIPKWRFRDLTELAELDIKCPHGSAGGGNIQRPSPCEGKVITNFCQQ